MILNEEDSTAAITRAHLLLFHRSHGQLFCFCRKTSCHRCTDTLCWTRWMCGASCEWQWVAGWARLRPKGQRSFNSWGNEIVCYTPLRSGHFTLFVYKIIFGFKNSSSVRPKTNNNICLLGKTLSRNKFEFCKHTFERRADRHRPAPWTKAIRFGVLTDCMLSTEKCFVFAANRLQWQTWVRPSEETKQKMCNKRCSKAQVSNLWQFVCNIHVNRMERRNTVPPVKSWLSPVPVLPHTGTLVRIYQRKTCII